jgi:exodeoxyribonuclease-1
MNKILAIAPKDLGRHLWTFQDSRLSLMLFRYRARNYPETLSMDELDFWNRDRRARLVETDDPAYFGRDDFKAALATARQSHETDSRALRLLDKLEAWLLESGISDL